MKLSKLSTNALRLRLDDAIADRNAQAAMRIQIELSKRGK